MITPVKPLGGPAYYKIPHLIGSRLGKGEHHLDQKASDICTGAFVDKSKPRRFIVQEKVDGACVSVLREGNDVTPLGRAGYPAIISEWEHIRFFATWAWENADKFLTLLKPGERVCGEWLALAHGTRYKLAHEPFVAFDIFDTAGARVPYLQFRERIDCLFTVPHMLHCDMHGISIEDVEPLLNESGHGAIDPVEGAVWRVERLGKQPRVEIIAKYVRPEKVDGSYMLDPSGPTWNWRPDGAH